MSEYDLVFHTSTDFRNSIIYATNRLLKEKTDKYIETNPNKIRWDDKSVTGKTSYYCPPGLTGCFEGKPVISTKAECDNQSKFRDTDDGTMPSNKNGWFLEWREGEDNNCYYGDYAYMQHCKKMGDESGPLNYDRTTHRCLMTEDYCTNFGYGDYTKGNSTNGDGGTCELSGGQTVMSYLGLGNTLTRFGACLKKL